jgi:hypothetical protein
MKRRLFLQVPLVAGAMGKRLCFCKEIDQTAEHTN